MTIKEKLEKLEEIVKDLMLKDQQVEVEEEEEVEDLQEQKELLKQRENK